MDEAPPPLAEHDMASLELQWSSLHNRLLYKAPSSSSSSSGREHLTIMYGWLTVEYDLPIRAHSSSGAGQREHIQHPILVATQIFPQKVCTNNVNVCVPST